MRRRNGFTLIELLVVVAIIAVLVAMLLPALAKAREATKLALCATHLRQWTIALTQYATEYNDFFPSTGKTVDWWGARNTSEYGGYGINCHDFFYLVYPRYLQQAEIFYCPLDRFRYARVNDNRYWPPYAESFGISYAYLGSYGKKGKCKTVSDPSNGIIADQQGYDFGPVGWYYNHGPYVWEGFKVLPSTVNYAFTDGHVQLVHVPASWFPHWELSVVPGYEDVK